MIVQNKTIYNVLQYKFNEFFEMLYFIIYLFDALPFLLCHILSYL